MRPHQPSWRAPIPSRPCLFYLLVCLANCYAVVEAADTFCGNLTVFQQQRFGKNSLALSSQETNDFKHCIDLCCSVPSCSGVTFNGFLSLAEGESNCLLVSCQEDKCELNPKVDYEDGVISVLIDHHNATQPPTGSPSDGAHNGSSNARPSTTPLLNLHGSSVRSVNPTWAVAGAVGVAVLCVLMSLMLLAIFVCYRRRSRNRKQTAQISAVKTGPTLHAYNPTL